MIRLSIAAIALASLAGCGSGTKAGNNLAAANAATANAAAPAAPDPTANAAAARLDGALPLDHPVLQAWRSSGQIALVRNGKEQRLAAKQPGRAVIADFFDYCSEPAAPPR
jgi:hypothetical protein